MQRYHHMVAPYLMPGAELVQEAVPVLCVVVNSVETPHVDVGHQPLACTQGHICILF